MSILKILSRFSLLFCFGVIMGSCANQQPIKIGLSVQLSGKYAQLGLGILNGVQLAIDDINANGGINGRPLTLLIEDDQRDPKIAKEVDAKLVEEGVVAIIGHASSSQTAAVFEQMNKAKVVLLSPTASSAEFSDQKDYFFRVTSSTADLGAALAQYAYDTMNLRRVSGIYDLGNEAYARSFWERFVADFEALGGEIEHSFAYTSGEDDLTVLANDVLAIKPSVLVFVTSPIDTAILAQYIDLDDDDDEKSILLSSAWAQASMLLEKGGPIVQGMVFASVYDADNASPVFQSFAKRVRENFGEKQSLFTVAKSYEAMQVLAEALKETGGEAAGLPEALVNVKDFPVLQGSITMNEYGDVKRDVYITIVEDGRFKVVDTVSVE